MPSRTRERQLARLAARRAAERKRKRRQRILAMSVGIAVAVAGVGVGAFAFIRRGGEERRTPAAALSSPSPKSGTDSASGGTGKGCGFKVTGEAGGGKALEPPAMTIDKKKDYTATLATSLGTFKVSLFATQAPCTVNNFVYLANRQFYDGVTFHRIADNPAVIQGGDPTGTGGGGPGYQFKDELDNDLKYEIGTLAMANSGPNTNGSQFFIVTGKSGTKLPKAYTIFGKVVNGMDVVENIHSVKTGGPTGEAPLEKVVIKKVTIRNS